MHRWGPPWRWLRDLVFVLWILTFMCLFAVGRVGEMTDLRAIGESRNGVILSFAVQL